MDVFNKLKNTVSNTFSSTVSSSVHSLSQLSAVLPGNPVTREYEVTAQIGSAGPGLLWKVFSGYKKSTKQKAAIFVFEKRLLDHWQDKAMKETILDILKKGVVQLTKLRHPQILTVQHPLEESRDSLAFATEPVFASLANILGSTDNLPSASQSHLKNFKTIDLEIKFGLYQLGESLAFLHNDVKMLHRNLCPESIVVNIYGDWKIFGFDFCASNLTPEDKPSWSCVDSNSIPGPIRPSVHHQAPECVKISSIGPSSDIFALGVLICFIHSPKNTIWSTRKDSANYERYVEELRDIISSTNNFDLPNSLTDTVKLMFHNDPQLRPDAYQFLKIEYFNHIDVKTLIYLDKLFQWDNLQKSQFYKGLPQILKQFPRRIVLQKVLPALQKEFVNAPMIPFLLPSILLVMEDCSSDEFNNSILPMLKQIFVIDEPPQISLVLLQKIELLLKWCSSDTVKNFIVPMMTRSLDSRLEQLQEQCLTALPTIVTIVGGPCMKNSLIPRMKKICMSGKSGNYTLAVQVNCLLCVSKILDQLDTWIIREEILPFLQQIPCSGEPALIMPIIGIYRLILTNSKFSISKETLATKVLPFLLPLCVDQSFSPKQYELLVSLVNDMICQVTLEHREALSQLQKTREFQENMTESLTQISSSASSLKGVSFDSPSSPTQEKPEKISSKLTLTLEEKQRLAKQEELNKRLQNQSPLVPSVTSPMSVKQKPKDLTDTLLSNNLNQLNWSANKTILSNSTQQNFSALPSKNYVNIDINNSSAAFRPQQQWAPNQAVTLNYNLSGNSVNSNNSNLGWTSPTSPVLMPNPNSNSLTQNTQNAPKLSAEDIMDFLK